MQEYFAECSEAFWSSRYITRKQIFRILSNFRRFRNDFYPFIHKELAFFDPTGYEMVKTAFNCDRRNTHIFTPPDYQSENYPLSMMKIDPPSALAGYIVFSPLVTPLILSLTANTMGTTSTVAATMLLLQFLKLWI